MIVKINLSQYLHKARQKALAEHDRIAWYKADSVALQLEQKKRLEHIKHLTNDMERWQARTKTSSARLKTIDMYLQQMRAETKKAKSYQKGSKNKKLKF